MKRPPRSALPYRGVGLARNLVSELGVLGVVKSIFFGPAPYCVETPTSLDCSAIIRGGERGVGHSCMQCMAVVVGQ